MCSIKTWTLIVAVWDMVIAVLSGTLVIIICALLINSAATSSSEASYIGIIEKSKRVTYGQALEIIIGVGVGVLLRIAAKFYLGLMLLRGVEKEDPKKCKIWMIVTTILVGLDFFWIMGTLPVFSSLIGWMISLVFESIRMVVVFKYLQRIERKCDIANNNNISSTESTGVGLAEKNKIYIE